MGVSIGLWCLPSWQRFFAHGHQHRAIMFAIMARIFFPWASAPGCDVCHRGKDSLPMGVCTRPLCLPSWQRFFTHGCMHRAVVFAIMAEIFHPWVYAPGRCVCHHGKDSLPMGVCTGLLCLPSWQRFFTHGCEHRAVMFAIMAEILYPWV